MTWKTKAERSLRAHKVTRRMSWLAATVAAAAFWDEAYAVFLGAAGVTVGLAFASQVARDLFRRYFDNASTSRTAAGISGRWDPDEAARIRNGR